MQHPEQQTHLPLSNETPSTPREVTPLPDNALYPPPNRHCLVCGQRAWQ